jgi:hypothetical protein
MRVPYELRLLFGLYLIQGISFAFVSGTLPALLAPRSSYTLLGILSITTYPYACKVLLAPIIDAYWLPSFGRRKSWTVPCTAISGILLAVIALSIDSIVEEATTTGISWLAVQLFLVFLFLAAQDVAVDAWALDLLAGDRLAYAASIQTVGMSTGNLLGYPILVSLQAHISLRTFLLGVAAVHVALSAAMLAVHEVSGDKPPRLRAVFDELCGTIASPESLRILAVSIVSRLGVAMWDTTAPVFYLKLEGAQRQHIAIFVILQAPVALCTSVAAAHLLAKRTSLTPERILARAYLLLMIATICTLIALHLHRVGDPVASAVTFACATMLTIGNKAWWTGQGTLFNRVVSRSAMDSRASHLTLLYSFADVGKFGPKPLTFIVADLVGFSGSCACFVLMGLAAWPIITCLLARLEADQQRVPYAPAPMHGYKLRSRSRDKQRSPLVPVAARGSSIPAVRI